MVIISYFETNEINNTYVNLQTGQSLDLDRGMELNVCTIHNNEDARKRGCKYTWTKRKKSL